MKKLSILIIGLLLSAGLFSQGQTVITGKMNIKPDPPVILLTYSFDTTKMREVETVVHTKTGEGNTFSFKIVELTPLTNCRIGFYNEGIKFVLSPGDSMHVEFTRGAMDSTIVFSGGNTAINNYLKQYELAFGKQTENNEIKTDQSSIQPILNLPYLKDRKLELLKRTDSVGRLDPEFVKRETIRINSEYFNSLMGRDVKEAFGDSIRNDMVNLALQSLSLSNDQALLDLREYREFIVNYIDFRLRKTPEEKILLQDYLDRIQMDLSGLAKTYCSYHYISDAIDGIHDGKEKILLRDYFMKISDDPKLTKILSSMDIRLTDRNYRDASRILLTSWSLIITLLIYAIVGFAIFKVVTYRSKSGKRIDPLYIIKGLIFLAALAYLSNYFIIYRLTADRTMAVGRVVTWILFVGLQLYYLIPIWFKKGKYQWYGLQMALLTILYFYVLISIGNSENHLHAPFQWLHHHSLSKMVNSWLILVTVSFLVYYVDLLIRRKQTIQYLFKEKLVSLEVVANVLIVFLFVSRIVSISIQDPRQQDGLVVFIVGILIFYSHAVYLIPQYMLKARVGGYFIATVAVFVGTILAFYLENIFGVYRSLLHIGVRIPFSEVIQLPEQFVIKTSLWIQFMIGPAMIYAFVKHQLTQKNIGFKMFRNKEAELQQLRSQVNPHFLFNSLNTVYAFALKENNPKTAEYIAKLANLMRYLVEDMDKEKIPVQKEISYIRDYINLQAIRSSVEHKIEINNAIEEEQNVMIAPMLMIPFVENAFKHGVNPNSVSELKVTFQIVENRFQFVIENSVDKNFEAFYKEKGFGIGIQNVRQRLEHIYPDRHTLSIADTGERFIVIMAVELSNLVLQIADE